MSLLQLAALEVIWIACAMLTLPHSILLPPPSKTIIPTNSSLVLTVILSLTPVRLPLLHLHFYSFVYSCFHGITDETQFYQKRFNFEGCMVVSHELHEANSQAWAGVNTTEDVSTYLKIFFPSITPNVVQSALDLYPESDYSSPGLRFSDMKQSFDLTAHNLAVTHALKNKTWNAVVELGSATHGADQSYYCLCILFLVFVLWLTLHLRRV